MTPKQYGPGAVWTPANAVTVLRILAAPWAFVLMWREPDHASWLLVAVWFLLSTTDLVDGRLARRYGTTRSGAFLDPLADKVLVLGATAVMCWVGEFPWVAWGLIAAREAAVSALRSRYARRGLAIQASTLAKRKTFLQLAAVGWVIMPITHDITWLGTTTLWLGVAVGLLSGVQYFVAGSRSASTMAR